MKLLIYCNKFDENDDLLGFFPGWVYALSDYFEKIYIITQHIGQYKKSEKIEVLSIDKNKLFPYRVLFFYSHLLKLKYNYDSVFFLMAPLWLVVSAPILKILRKKQILWYAVWKKTFKLKLAAFLSDRIVASVPESFPIKTDKLITVGQGIDTDFFKPNPSARIKNRILYLGRISPVKKIENIIKCVSEVEGVELDIVGGPVNPGDTEYLEKLKRQVEKFGLGKRVYFYGRKSHNQTLPFYQRADIFVNLTPTGSFDKAMIEAMASGCILLTSNGAFKNILQKPFLTDPDFESVSRHLLIITTGLSDEEKKNIREKLRSIVIENHSIRSMIPKLADNLKL